MEKKRSLCVHVCFLASALSAQSANADVITVGAAKDNTLYDNPDGALSNGVGEFFHVGNTLNGVTRRGLLMFDVSAVPAGSIIASVTLRLHMAMTSAGPIDISLHTTLADWGEGTSNALGNEGSGAPSTPGDATWIHTFYDTGFWKTPGGDFAASASAMTSVNGVGFYFWGSPQLIADVQQWVNNPQVNFGWVVIGNEAQNQTSKRFESHDSGTVEFQPALTVEYTPAPLCPANITGDKAVNVADLLAVVNGWGSCAAPCPPACPSDVSGDCAVNAADLLLIINAWGPCS